VPVEVPQLEFEILLREMLKLQTPLYGRPVRVASIRSLWVNDSAHVFDFFLCLAHENDLVDDDRRVLYCDCDCDCGFDFANESANVNVNVSDVCDRDFDFDFDFDYDFFGFACEVSVAIRSVCALIRVGLRGGA